MSYGLALTSSIGFIRVNDPMFKYVKHSLFHLMGLQAAIAIFLGGSFIVASLIFTLLVFVVGDLVLGDDQSTPDYHHPKILTWQLWLALPLLCLIFFSSLWQFSDHDLFAFGKNIQALIGVDLLTNRGNASQLEFIAALLLLGFNIGMIGTITAHELTHRTSDPISLLIGRWLLSFSFDTSFSVEHVYGHHRYVSTVNDPATAPRGRNVYSHIIISTIKGNISAWNIEKKRLAKKNQASLSIRNQVIRGYLMSAFLLVVSYFLAGSSGLLLFIGAGIWGKTLLEIVNYMEHYGMVRHPKTPVQPRHSWNTNKRVSSWAMFNLTRHSHHHAKASLPFHQLQPMKNSPEMISGYLGTIIIALIPPLWHRLMLPKVLDWDRNFASDEEQSLIEVANLKISSKLNYLS